MSVRRLVRVRRPIIVPRGSHPVAVQPESMVASAPPAQARPRRAYTRQTLAPITITGADIVVDLTNRGQLLEPASVKVGNLSGYVFEVTLNGRIDHLRASETNVFETMGATTMHLHPVSSSGLGVGTVLVAVAPPGDSFPGTWPIMNNRPSTTGSMQTLGRVQAGPGALVTATLLPDPSTLAIGWVEDFNTLNFGGNPKGFGLIGNTTNETYFTNDTNSAGFIDGGGLYMVRVPGVEEPAGFSFQLDNSANLLTGASAYLFAFLSDAVVTIRQNPTDFLHVTSDTALPAPWQAPKLNAPVGVGSIAAGASQSLFAAPSIAGMQNYLFQVALHFTGVAGSFGVLRNTAGSILRNIDFGVTQEYEWDFKGLNLGNVGLEIHNSSGVNSGAVNGGADFTQA